LGRIRLDEIGSLGWDGARRRRVQTGDVQNCQELLHLCGSQTRTERVRKSRVTTEAIAGVDGEPDIAQANSDQCARAKPTIRADPSKLEKWTPVQYRSPWTGVTANQV
jgi:hypothetical protein